MFLVVTSKIRRFEIKVSIFTDNYSYFPLFIFLSYNRFHKLFNLIKILFLKKNAGETIYNLLNIIIYNKNTFALILKEILGFTTTVTIYLLYVYKIAYIVYAE